MLPPERDISELAADPLDALMDLDASETQPGDDRLATKLEMAVYDLVVDAAIAENPDPAEVERLRKRARMARTLRASICEKIACW